MHRPCCSKGDMCILAIFQVALGFLLYFLATSARKLTSLRLGKAQRAPPWLEVLQVKLAALGFIFICSSTLPHQSAL
jgi:hypothetical protein